MPFILAKKVNMTQGWDEQGKVVPVTALESQGCKVTQVKTAGKDGYEAVQVMLGKSKREFRVKDGKFELGAQLSVADFQPGQAVKIAGVSKGRGFAGAVKRHGFHGAPASHGHDHPRAVGAIGQRFPQHVRPGLRMAGQMGNARSTIKGSKIVAVDPAAGLIFVKGGVPGATGSLVEISTV